MTLPTHISDREYEKFDDTVDGPAVRVTGTNFTGTFTPSGLTTGGKITEILIDNLTWTALPASPLAFRNALAIQNFTGQIIKLNYDNTTVGFVGVQINDGSERFYDITDQIVIYAKSQTSAVTVFVEEIA